MTLQQVDDALADWNNRLAAIAESVLELQADPTYRLLSGTSAPRLEGVTAARVEPALAGMMIFHEQFAVLQAAVGHAAALRAAMPRLFGAEAKLMEIQQVLSGRSVPPPARHRPASQRGLLSGNNPAERITLDELVGAMMTAIAAAREVVSAVSRAWSELAAKTDAAKARLQELGRQALQQNAQQNAEEAVALGSAAHLVQEIRTRVQVDPLGAAAEFDRQVQPLLDRAARMMALAERNRERIAQAYRRLDDLAELHRNTLAAEAEARGKIADCSALPEPLPEEKLRGLRDWLGRLAARQREGMFDAVEFGLRNWGAAADECAAQAQAALVACRAPVEQRNELRGRLEALKAKARVYGVAEMARLAELARQAEGSLYARPAELQRAGLAIAAYEKTLQVSKKEAVRG